jgi:integrative and conjugative element protein (TIGR02256 family)
MTDLEFWSDDRRYGLRVGGPHINRLLELCAESGPSETGGIFIGEYSAAHDCAIVTGVTAAPPDSRSGRTWFVRGVRGLQKMINRYWQRERRYYLGEWHFHPLGSPIPSRTDIDQMKEIACSEQYHCPEPVLLIISGDPVGEWRAGAFVFRRRQSYLLMQENSVGQLRTAQPGITPPKT